MKKIISCIITLFCVMIPINTLAQGSADEAYAKLSEDTNGKVLTFFYDSGKESGDYAIIPFSSSAERGWYEQRTSIYKVVIDESFANYSPTSTAYWFHEMEQLTSIEGLDNVNTASTTDMKYMFYNCNQLETLDIRTFNTVLVTDMEAMFCGSGQLTTIIVGDLWTTDAVVNSIGMFSGCTNLEGGRGTWHDFDHEDCTYARIDKAPDYPGYFTATVIEHAVELNTGTNGTISAEVSYGGTVVSTIPVSENTETKIWVPHGGNLTLNLIPSTNYEVSIVRLNTVDITEQVVSNVYTLENVITEHSISVSFGTPEAYAVLNSDYSILTFYYDKYKDVRYGMGVGPFNADNERGWHSFFGNTTKVVIDPSFADYRPTSTAYWFEAGGITALTEIDGLEYLNTSQVTDMKYMFSNLNLKSLDLRNFDTSNVKDMSWLFSYCNELESLDISSFNTANVENMSYMFCNCNELTSLDLGSFNTAKVTDMNNMFTNDDRLVTIYVGSGWTTNAVTNGESMFVNCERLTGGKGTTYSITETHTGSDYAHIDGGTTNPGYLTGLEDRCYPYAVLSDNNTILTFYYDNQKEARVGMDVGPFTLDNTHNTVNSGWYDYRESITKVVFDDSFADCTSLTSTSYWFRSCQNLSSIVGMSNLKTSNVTNMDYMFSGCYSLTSLDVSSFNTAKVTNMAWMFADCISLSILDISNFNTASVVNMRYMFSGCTALTTIYVSDSWVNDGVADNTSKSTNMFASCTSLKGSKGMTYDATKTNYLYAHVDDTPDNPGYFTDKFALQPYAILSDDNSTLTFYYDRNKIVYNGMSVEPFAVSSDREWDEYATDITNVVFDFSFADCTTLTSTDYWFSGFSNLMQILGINELKTTNVNSMSGMFEGCSKIETIDVSSFTTTNVTDMSYMFSGCSSLTSINLGNVATGNVTNMCSMFKGCSSLETLDVSGFTTSSVTDMSEMFSGCSSLSTIELSNFVTGNVTDMNAVFKDCSSLETINLNSFDTSNATSICYMFSGCSKLESLDISNFNTANVTDMGYLFNGCSKLTTINVADLVTDNVENMEYMFAECPLLLTLDISSFNTSKLKDMHNMFYLCHALQTVYVGDQWTIDNIDLSINYSGAIISGGQDVFVGCTNLVGGMGTTFNNDVTDPKDYSYAHIDGGTSNPGYFTDVADKGLVDEPYALLSDNSDEIITDNGTIQGKTLTFYYDKRKEAWNGLEVSETKWLDYKDNITTVVFDDSFVGCTTLTSTREWFAGCGNLSTISGISNLKTENVTDMLGMFQNCSSLTSLDLSSWNTTNVENMSQVFYGCTNLSTLTLSSLFSTAKVTDMGRLFYNCSKLSNLDLSSFNTENVLNMQEMFWTCSSLTELDLTGFNTSNVTNMSDMFFECLGLKTLDLRSFNTAKTEKMGRMFYNDAKLRTIYVGTGWTINSVLASEGSDVFGGCTKIVGGNGTKYDSNNVDCAYARIDDPNNNNPGYLTYIYTIAPYAVLSDGITKLTFYYDDKKADRKGMDIGPFNSSEERGWYPSPIPGNAAVARFIRNVVFDDSFADYRPVSTAYWFSDFASLTSITGLGNLNTSEVTDMHNMFYYCSVPENFDWSKLNTENVNIMTGMFAGSILTNPDFSDFETSQVTAMDSMFCNIGLTTLDLSSFKTEKVTKMNSMFNNCYYLANVNLSSFNTSSVTTMERMFQACNFETIDLSTFNTAKVANMSHMFENNNNLTTIYVDDGWSTESVTSSEGMFGQCMNLVGEKGSRLDIGNVNTTAYYAHIDGGQDNPGYFTEKYPNEAYAVLTNNEDEITTEEGSVRGKTLTFYYDKKKEDNNGLDVNHGWFEQRKLITSVVFDDSFAKCTTLTSLDSWFMECSNLKAITNISNLKTDNVTNMYRLFYGCSNLTEIDLSGFKTGNVSDMRYMFDSCLKLTTLDLSSFETDNVINMSSMFWGCSGLTDLNVSSFRTESVSDMSFMFYGCSSLTSIDVSNFNTNNVTDMRNMFSTCTNLTTIYVGENWSTTKVTTGEDMFSGCTSLVGSLGTTFNVDHMDYTFAHIDGGADNPGYLTDKYGVILTVKDNSREYGAANPTFEYTATGVAISGKPTITCDATATSPVGTYPITVSYTKAEGESALNVTCVNGTLTITKAPLKVTAKSYTIKRGGTLPTFEVEYAGFKNNETEDVFKKKPTITCEAKPDTVPGTYQIVVSGAEADNYEMEYVFGSLTITDDVVVTAKSYTRVYGDANPTFEFTSDGATLSGTPSITCAATATSPVGTYDIVIAKGDVTNSEVTYVNGTLTITKAPLTITAKSYTIKQGKDLPTFEVEYAGFKNNETEDAFKTKPTITCEAKPDTVPGTYQIVVSGAEADNYEMEYVFGSLTITDDAVVTANSYSRVYGDDNPTFAYSVDGATLSGTPSITCAATATSPVGTYDIVIAKGDVTNSEVTYVNGTLTITKAPLTITAKSYTIKQGKDLPTLEVEYSGFKNNETDTVFTTKPVVSTTATKYSEPGSYDIMVKDAEAANYEITYVKGTLTITKKTETYDGSSNVLTVEDGGNIDDALEAIGGREEAAKSIAAIVWKSTEPLTTEMLKGLDNPNMLIYVQSKEQAPKDRNNVVINGVAKYVELTDAGTGNHNFYAPVEFVAESITYTREFKQATRKNVSRGWEGICLPFTVQTFTHESHGEIAPFGNSASNYHFWLHLFTEDGIVNAETIEANKPYLISMPNSYEYYEEFNQAGKVQFASANVTIPVTETMAILLGDSAHIVPTFQVVEKSASVYTLNVGDSIISTLEGSIFVNNYRDVRPFEIYTFHEPNRNAGTRAISVSSLFGGGTTGIIDVMEKQNSDEVKVYSINGTLIKKGNRNEVMTSLPKGLYIIGNQKVMVK